MTLKELHNNTNWPSVREKLFSLYPDLKKKETGYQKVYEQLSLIEAQENTSEILLSFIEEEEPEFNSYIHLSAIETSSNPPESYNPMFSSWEEWMGMSINETTLKDFSLSEILAHCLLEMTLTGFDPETRKRTEDELYKQSLKMR
ncbi:DUF6557 family protein [Marinilabilia salmonicolor]|uniref:Uncharacterized protein n=1 Tax=Marinilabilia salmonicolor TaxID=989 RepID=A0A368UJ92_9BACT|nr:DUF6557 family protein [Marinilabilia salmonicolor]RCW27471.1 hypothetical protein DFO77_1373 [Marinilabilia salmonicolor]